MWIPFTELHRTSKGLKLLRSIFWSPGPFFLDTTLGLPSTDYPSTGFHPALLGSSALPFLVCGPEPVQERCAEKVSFSPPFFPSG